MGYLFACYSIVLELIMKTGKGEFGACASVNLIKNLI